MDDSTFLLPIIEKIKTVPEISAIVLGGSRASGTHRPDSDYDIGLYYHSGSPIVSSNIKDIAEALNDTPDPVVTEIGGWGKWVNGGAWLTIKGQRVDFIYRNIESVAEVVQYSIQGKKEFDFFQQPPYGFHSYIYCAEIKVCKPIYDPNGEIDHLKSLINIYPPALKESIIKGFLKEAEFSIVHAKKFATRNETYLLAGCLTRIISDFVQVLYAYNEDFFIGDKKFYKDIERFLVKPTDFLKKSEHILGFIGETNDRAENSISLTVSLFKEMVELSSGLYVSKFGII